MIVAVDGLNEGCLPLCEQPLSPLFLFHFLPTLSLPIPLKLLIAALIAILTHMQVLQFSLHMRPRIFDKFLPTLQIVLLLQIDSFLLDEGNHVVLDGSG